MSEEWRSPGTLFRTICSPRRREGSVPYGRGYKKAIRGRAADSFEIFCIVYCPKFAQSLVGNAAPGVPKKGDETGKPLAFSPGSIPRVVVDCVLPGVTFGGAFPRFLSLLFPAPPRNFGRFFGLYPTKFCLIPICHGADHAVCVVDRFRVPDGDDVFYCVFPSGMGYSTSPNARTASARPPSDTLPET